MNKAGDIVSKHGAIRISKLEATKWITDSDKAVIVVVCNGAFEAAGFAFDKKELLAFSDEVNDPRPRSYLVMDRERAKALTGYNGK